MPPMPLNGETHDKPLVRSTIRDVAALAEVSAKTVSRVVNGERYVSAEVADRVNQAIRRLGYRHNLAASALRAGTTSSAVGVILVDISNPFSSAIHRAVQDAFAGTGIAVLSASTDEEAERERAAVDAFVKRRVDGLIVMPASHDHAYLGAETAAGMHVVMIDRPPAFLNVDSVVSENREGATRGVEHLIAAGHRRIGFVGNWPSVTSSRQRFEGYGQALQRAGIPFDSGLVAQGFRDEDEVRGAATALLTMADTPSALFVGQNVLCAPVIRAVRALGRSGSVAIVGFDGFDSADLIEPGLTVVTQDPVAMGRTAAEILLGRIQGNRSPARADVLPVQLVERGSGEIPGPAAARPGKNRRSATRSAGLATA